MEETRKVDIRSLTVEQLIKIMTTQGFPEFDEKLLNEDVRNGAPMNEDGTVNLLDYGAWLFIQRHKG